MGKASGIRAGRAYVELGVNDVVSQQLKAAQKTLEQWGTKLASVGASIGAIGGAIVAPMVAGVTAFASAADKMSDMAARTGVSTEALSQLSYAARLSGTSIEMVEKSIRKMQVGLVSAASGEGLDAISQSIEALGLSVRDLAGMSPEQQFEALAAGIAKIQNPTERAAAAFKIFGRSGTQLLPMFASGKGTMAELRAEADRLGLTMSGSAAAGGKALQDSFTTLEIVTKKVATALGAAVVQDMQAFATGAIEVVSSAVRWVKANSELVVTVARIGGLVVAAGASIAGLGVGLMVAGKMVGTLAVTWTTFGAAVAAITSPVGIAVAALGTLAGATLYYTGAGSAALDAFRGAFADVTNTINDVLDGVRNALTAGDISLAAEVLWAGMIDVWERNTQTLQNLWRDCWYGVQAAGEIGINNFAGNMIDLAAIIQKTWSLNVKIISDACDSIQEYVARAALGWQYLLGNMSGQEYLDAVKAGRDVLGDKQLETSRATVAELDAIRQAAAARHAANADAHERRMEQIGGESAAADKAMGERERKARERFEKAKHDAKWAADAAASRAGPDVAKYPLAMPSLGGSAASAPSLLRFGTEAMWGVCKTVFDRVADNTQAIADDVAAIRQDLGTAEFE